MTLLNLKNSLAAATLALATGFAPVAWAETLTDAMISAYKTSGLLQQNRALLRAADEDVAQAAAALRPILSYAASVNYTNPTFGDEITGALGISAQMLLYDFGASALAEDAAKETVLATREALVGIEQDVLLRAAAAYLGVRREAAFLGLRQNNVRVIAEQLRAARDRFEVGEVTRTDVSIAEARLAAAQSGLAAQQGALARAQAEYAAATGKRPGQLSAPGATPATASSLQSAKSTALQRHPTMRQAQRQVTISEINLARAKSSVNPTVTGSGNFGFDFEGEDRMTLGVELRGPLYAGGTISSQQRQAQARKDAARAGLYTARQGIEQSVTNAWANLQVANATVDASDQQVRAARLALRGAQEEFAVGSRTTLDVLDREQELLDAETNAVAAQIDRSLASYQLLSAMGLLTVQNLGLPVVQYDPSEYYNSVKNAPAGLVSPQGEALDRVLKSLGKN